MSPGPGHAATPYRWVMLGALWFCYLGFGVVTSSMAPLIAPIAAELGLSHSAMGVVLGAWALVYIAAAIPAGAALDRFGSKKGLAAGILIVAISGFARAAAIDFYTLFLAVGLFGIGGPLMSVGAPKLIAQWFDSRERGTAVGIYMTGPFIGTALAFASANSVLMPLFGGQWRIAIAMMGGVAFLSFLLWIVVARDPAVRPTSTTSASDLRGFAATRALLAGPVVRTVLAIALAGFMFNHALNNWLPEILRSRGMDAVSAGYWAALPTIVGILSALTIPRFAIAERRVAILMTLYGCLVVATLLLAFTSGAGIVAGLVLLGIARIMGPIALLVLMEAPGVDSRNMGAASGLYFTVGEVGGVAGPVLVGILADATGNFTSGILALTALTVYLFAMTFVLRRVLRR